MGTDETNASESPASQCEVTLTSDFYAKVVLEMYKLPCSQFKDVEELKQRRSQTPIQSMSIHQALMEKEMSKSESPNELPPAPEQPEN